MRLNFSRRFVLFVDQNPLNAFAITQPRDAFFDKTHPIILCLRGRESNRAGDRARFAGRERRAESPTVRMIYACAIVEINRDAHRAGHVGKIVRIKCVALVVHKTRLRILGRQIRRARILDRDAHIERAIRRD